MSSTEQMFGRAWQGTGSRRNAAAAGDFLRNFNSGLTRRQRLEQVRFIARLMDDRFVIPCTSPRFGLDSVVGLFPGFGDVTAISLLIVHDGWQSGASKFTLVACSAISASTSSSALCRCSATRSTSCSRRTARIRACSRPQQRGGQRHR